MTTYEEMEQLQAFARIDGALIAGLWTLSFACFIGNFYAPLLGIFAFAIGAFSLVFAAMRLRKFRDEVRDGFISFRRALAYGIMQYLNASLLFCVGSMTIVGSLNAGLTKDYELLYTKSIMDLISSAMLAASLGPGVLLAAPFVLVFQGGICLLAGVLAPYLGEYARGELICAGSVLILLLGFNLLGIIKFKVADYLPALLIAPLLCLVLK